VDGLPEPCRTEVLGEDERSPQCGAKWSIAKLEAVHHRLLVLASRDAEDAIEVAVRQAQRLKQRIDRCRETLVLANLGLVHRIAIRQSYRGIPLADLVQEGMIGLIEAVDRFETGRGCKLSTYAIWWIRKSLFDAFAHQLRLIRLPAPVSAEVRRLKQASEDLGHSLGRKPTERELAAKAGLSKAKVGALIASSRDPLSFDSLDKQIDLLGFLALLPDDPLRTTMEGETRDIVAAAIERLGPRQRDFVRLRFGFDSGEPLTLNEIGKIYGVTRERARQVVNEALERLRRILSARGAEH